MKEDLILSDVEDIFGEFDEGFSKTGYNELERVSFASNGKSSEIQSLGEVFCEYYLSCPDDVSSFSQFLEKEELKGVISEKDYQKLVLGEAYLSDEALEFFRLKFPFFITDNKMHILNTAVRVKNKSAEVVKFDTDFILAKTKELHNEKEEERRKLYHEYDVRYRIIHREEINEKAKERYHSDDEYRNRVLELRKKRYDEMTSQQREKIYAQQRKKYATDEEYKEYVRKKNERRHLAEKLKMQQSPEYAEMVREKRRLAKQKLREKQKNQ